MNEEKRVKRYLRQNAIYFIDKSGEYNLTKMAEDALAEFDWLDDGPDAEIWDWAYEVAEELQD